MAARRRAAAATDGSVPARDASPASNRARRASTTWSRNTRRSRPRSSSRSSRSMPAAASPLGERVDEPVHELTLGEAEQLAHGLGLDAVRGRGEELVEDRLGVAHPARGQAGHDRDGLGVGLPSVGGQDPLQLAADLVHGEPPDVEPLETRQDRGREVLGVGGREHERDELGRLLERLEERVPRVARDLVRLVEDVDLAPQVRRRVVEAVAELAHVVDAAVGRGVDLDQVQGASLADGDARRADVARVRVRAEVRAVERLGQDPRERRLAGAAGPGEQDRVRDVTGGDRVPERRDHRLLADDLGERLRPPAAVEGLVGGSGGQRHSRRVAISAPTAEATLCEPRPED